MRSIRLHLTILGRPAAEVYATLSDLGDQLGCRPGDFRVMISAGPETGAPPPQWEANFRRGVLQWGTGTEIPRRTAAGAGSVFDGAWSCVDDGDGTAVTFAARIDLGIAARAGAAETRAVRALIDDAVGRLSGLFDGNVRVDDVVIQSQENAVSAA